LSQSKSMKCQRRRRRWRRRSRTITRRDKFHPNSLSTAANSVETIPSAPHCPTPLPTRATRITVRCSTNARVKCSFSSDTMRFNDDNDADNGDEDDADDDNRLERRRWWKLIRIAHAYNIQCVQCMAIYYYYTHHSRVSGILHAVEHCWCAYSVSDVISIKSRLTAFM